MWFQVELPQPAMIAEVQFDAGAPGGRGVAGGRGGQRGQRRGRRGGSARRRPPAAAAAAGVQPPGAGTAAPAAQPPPVAARTPPVFGSFPLGYRVQVSMDGKTWGAPVAEGKGSPRDHDRDVPAGPGAKFIRVTQTDTRENAAAVVGAQLPGVRRR